MRLHLMLLVCYITVTNELAESYNVTKCTSRLLSPRSDTVAIYDEKDTIYIFGGQLYVDGDFILYDEIEAYNINTDTLEVVGHLPRTAYGGSAWLDPRNNGHIIYIRGDGTFVWNINTANMSTISMAEWHGNEALYTAIFRKNEYKIMTFGGLSDSSLIYELNLETLEHGKVGQLPMPSELSVGIYIEEREATYIFAGKMGTWNPILLMHDHQLNATFVFPAEFPSWRHGDGNLIWTGESIYLVGATIWNGAQGDGLMKISPEKGENEFIPLEGFDEAGLSTFGTVYVPKLNRIYIFGGYDVKNIDRDEIYYVELGE